nr:retrotransposon Orf1 [Tanacetum cinerariifolium]
VQVVQVAPKPFVQVNKIASSCEICSGPHDTQYCMKNPDQAFVDYASSRTNEARGDWNSPKYQDTAGSKGKKVMNALSFYKMETNEISERTHCYHKGRALLVKFIINPEEDAFEPEVILGRSFLRLTKGVVDFGNGVTIIHPEPDPFEDDYEKTGKSSDELDQLLDFNFDDILDEIWKDNVELDGKTVKEDEKAVKRIKGEALGEKDNLGAFIFPIRLERRVNKNALTDTGTTESDSNDEEEYVIKRNKFGAPIYSLKPTLYLNCTNLEDRSSAIHTVTNPFWKINVWKKVVSFIGSLPVPLKQVNWKPDHKGCYTNEEEATGQWRTELRLTDPYGNVYLQGFTTKKTDQKLSKLQEHTTEKLDRHDLYAQDNTKQWKNFYFHKFTTSFFYGKDVARKLRLGTTLNWSNCFLDIYSPCVMNWDVLNQMGCDGEIDDMLRIRLRKAGSNEEIFTSVAWIRAFNINEPIYAERCHEFYSTYEFDEVCTDDELQSKKIIKFRLGEQAHILTLLEFARRLGLYQAVELEEEGFNVYFEGGLRNDDNFNAHDYWLSIRREDKLSRNPILRVIHKMITYGLCHRTTRYGKIQKNDLWLLSMFDARHQNGKCKVLTEDVPGMPRVGIPRPPRASMQDLYDRMDRMEIRQDAIEQMEYRQSYHWDRYHGVFEHMDRVYIVPPQGAYNPPGYAQSQYDQYYQQYQPPPPQYQQHQDDDE